MHRVAPVRPLALVLLLAALAGCSYVNTTVKQAGYSVANAGAPRQRIHKHMLARETFFVFGRLEHTPAGLPEPLAVLAVSDVPRVGEVVDVNHLARDDSYYGLNLPPGTYRLLVASDRNHDGLYEPTEVVAGLTVTLDAETAPDRVMSDCDLDLRHALPKSASDTFRVAVQKVAPRTESVVFPKGTLRSLEDPIFAPAMADLGMYQPAAFLEQAPMMFYALEESSPQRVPVIFVHGIGGSPREFAALIAKLDRKRYQPWFFYYPSGSDLHQVASMFHRLFLSGKVIPLEDTPVAIVAHSMGGLVVREALNLQTGAKRETPVARFITLASPLGGHPGARNAKHAPVVIPSWRDLDPDSRFIHELHRRPLPATLEHHLLFAFGDDRTVKLGDNSDGVVPLTSQLNPAVQKEAKAQYGFDTTHTGILRDDAAIAQTIALIEHVKSSFPPDHLAALDRGGYDLPLGKNFSPLEALIVRQSGIYLDALADGALQPSHPFHEHFIRSTRGEVSPNGPAETAWQKLQREFPDRRRDPATK